MQAMVPLMIASTALQVGGSLVQGVAGMKAGNATARAMETNAVQSVQEGEAEAARLRDESRFAIGRQLAGLAGNGFDLSGSAETVLRESAIEAELDIMDARRQAASRARAYREQGKAAKAEGKAKLVGGMFGAASAVANAGRDYASAQSGGYSPSPALRRAGATAGASWRG